MMEQISIYSGHRYLHNYRYLTLFQCHQRYQWKFFLRQLQVAIDNKNTIVYKKKLCEKLLSCNTINVKTLFLYTALGFYEKTHSRSELIEKNTNTSLTPIMALTVAKDAVQHYLQNYQTLITHLSDVESSFIPSLVN